MHHISIDRVCSIKRVMSTNNFILKKLNDKIILLTINDKELKKISLQSLVEDKDKEFNFTDSLHI
jgi:hypothetical protein